MTRHDPKSAPVPVTRVAGILVGGASSRMGGAPKGLLEASDGRPIALRTARLFEALGARVVFLGNVAAYDSLGYSRVADARGFEGPLAGLASLLALTEDEDRVFLAACDMPFLTHDLVRELDRAANVAVAAAPRIDGRWEPMFSVFSAGAAKAVLDRVRSPSGLLETLGALPLDVTSHEALALVDWDTPGDVREARP